MRIVQMLAVGVLVPGTAFALSTGPLACLGVPPVGTLPTDLSDVLRCPQFALPGTLTSMTLTVTAGIAGTMTITNHTPQTQTGFAETQTRVTVGPLAGFPFSSPLFTLIGATGPFSLGSSEAQTFAIADSGGTSLTNSTVFTPYLGAGLFNIPLATVTQLLLSVGGGGVGATQLTQGEADATITYDYNQLTTVPEPSTLALFGIGAAVLRRWRR